MARKKKMTVTVLRDGAVPRQKGQLRGAARSVGFAGGDVRTFAPTRPRRLQEIERLMKQNGRSLDLGRTIVKRRREEESELDRKPWKVKTLAAETRARTRERETAEHQEAIRARVKVQSRLAKISEEAEALRAFRWRQEQYKAGKGKVA